MNWFCWCLFDSNWNSLERESCQNWDSPSQKGINKTMCIAASLAWKCDCARGSQPPKLLLKFLWCISILRAQSQQPPPLPGWESSGLGQQRWTFDFTPNSEEQRSCRFSTVWKTDTTIWRHATKSGFDLEYGFYHRTASPGQQTELTVKNYTEKCVCMLRACSSVVRHTWSVKDCKYSPKSSARAVREWATPRWVHSHE